MIGKYKCEYNPLGGVILDENGKYIELTEIVDKLNDGEKHKLLFEIAKEVIRNNLSQKYVDYIMRAELQLCFDDLDKSDRASCRCQPVPFMEECR